MTHEPKWFSFPWAVVVARAKLAGLSEASILPCRGEELPSPPNSTGCYRVDVNHPAYPPKTNAGKAREAVARQPCTGCGDKKNIAEVKASPAAMEAYLAGE